MKLSATERVSLGTVQRRCRRCREWFYVESSDARESREVSNAYAAKHGGEFTAPPKLGKYCPECAASRDEGAKP